MNGKLFLTTLFACCSFAAQAAVETRGNLVLDNIPGVDSPLTARLDDYLN